MKNLLLEDEALMAIKNSFEMLFWKERLRAMKALSGGWPIRNGGSVYSGP